MPSDDSTWVVQVDVEPVIPDELWMIWEPKWGGWTNTIDEIAGDMAFLAFTDEEDARTTAENINKVYQYHCVPVRVR